MNEHLYRKLQIAVRRTLGRRSPDELPAEQVDIDQAVSAEVRRKMETSGVREAGSTPCRDYRNLAARLTRAARP